MRSKNNIIIASQGQSPQGQQNPLVLPKPRSQPSDLLPSLCLAVGGILMPLGSGVNSTMLSHHKRLSSTPHRSKFNSDQ